MKQHGIMDDAATTHRIFDNRFIRTLYYIPRADCTTTSMDY
jgi:hypothetical protein